MDAEARERERGEASGCAAREREGKLMDVERERVDVAAREREGS
jgi:hypothetical protein